MRRSEPGQRTTIQIRGAPWAGSLSLGRQVRSSQSGRFCPRSSSPVLPPPRRRRWCPPAAPSPRASDVVGRAGSAVDSHRRSCHHHYRRRRGFASAIKRHRGSEVPNYGAQVDWPHSLEGQRSTRYTTGGFHVLGGCCPGALRRSVQMVRLSLPCALTTRHGYGTRSPNGPLENPCGTHWGYLRWRSIQTGRPFTRWARTGRG